MDPTERAAAETRTLADALQKKIREARLSYGAVERRLGMGKDTLRHLLSGRVELKVRHVFGILAALDLEPSVFFAEHLGLPMTREDFVRRERLLTDLTEGAARRQLDGFDLIARTLREKGMLSDEEESKLVWKLHRIAQGEAVDLESP